MRAITILALALAAYGGKNVNAHPARHLTHAWKTLSQQDLIVDLQFSPNGRILAVSQTSHWRDHDSQTKLYDTRTWRLIHVFKGQELVDFSPDGKTLTTLTDSSVGFANRSLTLWRTATWRRWHMLPRPVSSAEYSKDSKFLLTTRDAGPANNPHPISELWNAATLRRIVRYPTGAVAYFWPGTNLVATTAYGSETAGQSVNLHQPGSKRIWRTTRSRGGVLAVSTDSRWFVTQDDKQNVFSVWKNFQSHRRYTVTERGRVNAVSLSPDNRWLASVGDEWDSRLWDLRTGRKAYYLKGGQEPVYVAAFSPDGRLLALGGADAAVWLWRVPRS